MTMLAIVSKLFTALTNLRSFANDFGLTASYRSKLPVVCVGNAVVGGAGKTPTVQWLVAELSTRGYRPVVLSRGYKGHLAGPHLCGLNDLALAIGDEPALLTRSGCKVVVSKDKVAGVKFIESGGLGDVVVLDDGFQHFRLGRDCNILVIPAKAKLTDETLPVGRLRESYATALTRADIALVSQKSTLEHTICDDLISNINRMAPAVPVASSKYCKPQIVGLDGKPVQDCYEVCLVTAVANPEGVRSTALAAGVKVVSERFFPDHHRYTLSELQSIACDAKCPLLVTEKDAVKLVDLGFRDFYILKVVLNVSGPLLEVVLSRIEGKIRQHEERAQLCAQMLEASPLKRQKLVQLMRLCRDLRGEILDLGSDNGAVSFALRKLGGKWQTGDLDPEVVAGARFFLGDTVAEIHPERLNLSANHLDAVVVLDMFEHLERDSGLMDEIARVLKPGGQLIVNVPNPHNGLIRTVRFLLGQNDKVHGHVRPGYTPGELRRLLGARFTVESEVPYSRAFTEIADTLVTLGVDLLKSAKRSSSKGRVVSATDAGLRKTIKLGRLVAPVLNLALLIDYLFPLTNTNLLMIRARKT